MQSFSNRSFSAAHLVTGACLALMILTGCASRPDLSTRLAEGGRSPEDKARDAARRPGSVLEFLGVEAGMTTLDVIASGGYYTEALSEAVGPDGKVYAQNNAFVLQLRDGTNEKAITARLANDRLPNVMRLDRELNDLGIDPGSVDVAITALNFHDIYNGRGVEAAGGVLKAIRGTLADDGVLGLIDHAGNPGNDNEKLHRIEEAKVIETALAAGYRLEATSDVLRNPDDDRTLFVFDPSLQRNTDRFVLKLRKAR